MPKEDRKIYEDCNVESSVSELDKYTERCTINHAILHGNQVIKEVHMVTDAKKRGKPSICRVCLQYIPDFASSPKTKLVTARTLGGNVFFDTVEMKTLKEFFLSSYKSKNCLKTAVNLKNGQNIS
ncbi:hypothetical protein MUO56_06215 [Candidatus Bathyarchaeota archaeon]|nr:hypothetical protein [Candidatus Bathyarchaeota archaeon]